MAKITFEHIDKVYDNGFQAVYDFNLEIGHGEFVVIIGPSGCGKSTMMRIIAGLEDITKGKIYFDDVCVNTKSPRQRGIAMVFQSYALYPHLSVYDNMAFGLTIEGFDEDYIEHRVQETADILGMTPYLQRKPKELSGGQCQRVAVGRAILRHPKVFLMDEPLSNLDAKQRVTMRSEIMDIHRKTGATTIYVTHDQVEAMTMADRIVVMRDGVIQQTGTPRELYFSPINRFVAGFIGDPPMNFIPCTVKKGNIFIKDTDIVLNLSVYFDAVLKIREDTEILLGFRPESAEVGKGEGDSCDDGIFINATVQLLELYGDCVSVFALVGAHSVIVRMPPDAMPAENSEISLFIPLSCIYLFRNDKDGSVMLLK